MQSKVVNTYKTEGDIKMTFNQMTVKANLKRIDICDLLIACRVVDEATDKDNTKWAELHDKLKAILDEFDAKQGF